MSEAMITEVIQAISQCLPADKASWPLHEPVLTEKQWGYIKQCFDEGFVSSIGRFVNEFEAALQTITGAQAVVATVNGTAALHLCYQLVGVKKDDEVLTTPLSFIATSNAISYCHAVPHYVDIEAATLAIDADKLRQYLHTATERANGVLLNKQTGRRIAALSVVHVFGHPARLDALQEVCNEFALPLVEDAAEALGSYYCGEHVGNVGHVAALSFNGNKIVTTGAGGAIMTNDRTLAERAKHLSTTAKVAHPFEYYHDAIGYNYRLANLNAALGVGQLEQLSTILTAKRQLLEKYQHAFAELTAYAEIMQEPLHSKSNYWLQTLILKPEWAHCREAILTAAHAQNIFLRPNWALHHQLPIYQQCPRMDDLSVAEDFANRIISLPSLF